jgi:hypothetical protein
MPEGLYGNSVRNGDKDRCLRFDTLGVGGSNSATTSSGSDSKIPRVRITVSRPRLEPSEGVSSRFCKELCSDCEDDGVGNSTPRRRVRSFVLPSCNGFTWSSGICLCSGSISIISRLESSDSESECTATVLDDVGG